MCSGICQRVICWVVEMAVCSPDSTYHCEYRLKSRGMQEHERCKHADVNDETDELLSGELC
jgi:hypothetical protein